MQKRVFYIAVPNRKSWTSWAIVTLGARAPDGLRALCSLRSFEFVGPDRRVTMRL